MPICVFIGDDRSGKSTLIKQLKEKYNCAIIAFPTPEVRKELESIKIDYTDIHSILNYHMRFLLDFCEYKSVFKHYLRSDKLLLVDRYIYCSLAYLRHAVLKHHSEEYWTENIRPLLWGYFDLNLHYPNYVILLKKDTEIQKHYEIELEEWKRWNKELYDIHFKYSSIEGLKEDTFTRVEALLKNRGYI